MKCPFLREAAVAYCRAAPYRKEIPRTGRREDEMCSSPRWVRCPDAERTLSQPADLPKCPYLIETEMQFCAAAPIRKLIPCTDGPLSTCNGDGHRYCPFYRQRAFPGGRSPQPAGPRGAPAARSSTREIPVPERLAFAPSHTWIDVAEDGTWHAGVDAFVARVLGRIDGVRFDPDGRPIIGIDLGKNAATIAFPRHLAAATANTHLRHHPESIIEDPYGAGWVFAGIEPGRFRPLRRGWHLELDFAAGGGPADAPDREAAPVEELLRGEKARAWMRAEAERLSRFLHERVGRSAVPGEAVAFDGGEFSPGVAARLDQPSLDELFRTFFGASERGTDGIRP